MTPRPLRVLFDAMHHGKHSFDEFLRLDISANYSVVAWKNRTIYRPSQKLRAIHGFLNNFLFDHLAINPRVAYAYRRGASPRDALLPHASGRAFYQTDLTKFFESISSALIEQCIKEAETPIEDLAHHTSRILGVVTVNGMLPIGFATSPAISNACLRPFDEALENHCLTSRLIYTRYADDIIISGESRDSLASIEQTIEELLDEKLGPGFSINRAKTHRTTIGRRVRALGLAITPHGSITLDSEVKRKIEYQLHYLVKNQEKLAEIYDADFDAGLERLAGHISHVHSVDPRYLDKLRRKYGATVIDGLLHRTLK